MYTDKTLMVTVVGAFCMMSMPGEVRGDLKTLMYDTAQNWFCWGVCSCFVGGLAVVLLGGG